jgi:hypothetical protein
MYVVYVQVMSAFALAMKAKGRKKGVLRLPVVMFVKGHKYVHPPLVNAEGTKERR